MNPEPGAPLPDLLQVFVERFEDVRALQVRCNADGYLFDGTPARATVVQNGLFMTPYKGAVGDGFPVERIDVHAIGGVPNATLTSEQLVAEAESTTSAVFLPFLTAR